MYLLSHIISLRLYFLQALEKKKCQYKNSFRSKRENI